MMKSLTLFGLLLIALPTIIAASDGGQTPTSSTLPPALASTAGPSIGDENAPDTCVPASTLDPVVSQPGGQLRTNPPPGTRRVMFEPPISANGAPLPGPNAQPQPQQPQPQQQLQQQLQQPQQQQPQQQQPQQQQLQQQQFQQPQQQQQAQQQQSRPPLQRPQQQPRPPLQQQARTRLQQQGQVATSGVDQRGPTTNYQDAQTDNRNYMSDEEDAGRYASSVRRKDDAAGSGGRSISPVNINPNPQGRTSQLPRLQRNTGGNNFQQPPPPQQPDQGGLAGDRVDYEPEFTQAPEPQSPAPNGRSDQRLSRSKMIRAPQKRDNVRWFRDLFGILRVGHESFKRGDRRRFKRGTRDDDLVEYGGRFPGKIFTEVLYYFGDAYEAATESVGKEASFLRREKRRSDRSSCRDRSMHRSYQNFNQQSGAPEIPVEQAIEINSRGLRSASNIADLTSKNFKGYRALEQLFRKLGVKNYRSSNIKSIVHSVALWMADYGKDLIERRNQAIETAANGETTIPIDSLPKAVPVDEILRNFVQSMLTIATNGRAMVDLGDAILEHYQELKALIIDNREQSSVELMNTILAALARTRIHGSNAEKIQGLLSVDRDSDSNVRPSSQVLFIFKSIVDVMSVFRGKLDARNARAIRDSLIRFSRNYRSLMDDLSQDQDFYGGNALPADFGDSSALSESKRLMKLALFDAFRRSSLSYEIRSKAKRVFLDTLDGQAVFSSLINILLDPELGPFIVDTVDSFTAEAPIHDAPLIDYIQASTVEISIIRQSVEDRRKEQRGSSSEPSSQQQQPLNNGQYDDGRRQLSDKEDQDIIKRRFGDGGDKNLAVRYQDYAAREDSVYPPDDARYALWLADKELRKVWGTFARNARHAEEVTAAFLLAAKELHYQWQKLRPNYSEYRLESFVRAVRKNLQQGVGRSRAHAFFSLRPSQRHSKDFRGLVHSILPRHRGDTILDTRAFDAISDVIYGRIVNLQSGEILRQFDELVTRISPIIQGRRSVDLGVILRSLGNQSLSILLRMLFVPDLEDVFPYLERVLMPDSPSKSNSTKPTVH